MMGIKKIIIPTTISAAAVFIFAFFPIISAAQTTTRNIDTYTLLEPLPCLNGTSTGNNPCDGGLVKTVNLQTYVVYIFRLMIAIAAFAAVIMITWGGFEYMTSEAYGKKDAAKQRIWNAIWGLLGALASYLILYTIDPRLVSLNTSLPPIQIKKVEIFSSGDTKAMIGALTQENTIANAALKSKIANNQALINSILASKGATSESELSEADKLQVEKLKAEDRTLDLTITQNTDNLNAKSEYMNFINEINDPANGYNAAQVRKAVQDDIKIISVNLSDIKRKLLAAGDIAGAQKVQNQIGYYSMNLEFEGDTINALKDPYSNPADDVIKSLRASLTEDFGDPALNTQYRKDTQDRIDKITKAQGK